MSAPYVTTEGSTSSISMRRNVSNAFSASPALAHAEISVVYARQSGATPASYIITNAAKPARASPARAHADSSMLYTRTSRVSTKATNSNATATASRRAHCLRKFLCETRAPSFCTPALRSARSSSSALCRRPCSTSVSYSRRCADDSEAVIRGGAAAPAAESDDAASDRSGAFSPSPPVVSTTGMGGRDSSNFARGHPCRTPSWCAAVRGSPRRAPPRRARFSVFSAASFSPSARLSARSRNSSSTLCTLGTDTAAATTSARGFGLLFGANSSWSLEPPSAVPAAATRGSARDATRSGPAPVSDASRRFQLRPETPVLAGVLASEEDAPALVLAATAGAQGAARAAARPDIFTGTARSRKPPHAPLTPPLEAEGSNEHARGGRGDLYSPGSGPRDAARQRARPSARSERS